MTYYGKPQWLEKLMSNPTPVSKRWILRLLEAQLRFSEIAEIVGVTRETIARVIASMPGTVILVERVEARDS